MSRFGVSPEKEKELLERMARVGIGEGDLLEKFIRSSGAGGCRLGLRIDAPVVCRAPRGVAQGVVGLVDTRRLTLGLVAGVAGEAVGVPHLHQDLPRTTHCRVVRTAVDPQRVVMRTRTSHARMSRAVRALEGPLSQRGRCWPG